MKLKVGIDLSFPLLIATDKAGIPGASLLPVRWFFSNPEGSLQLRSTFLVGMRYYIT